MKKSNVLLYCFLVLLPLTSWSAVNGFSPFHLIPENPVEGENVQLYYSGCDQPAPNVATNEYYYLEQDADLTNIIVSIGFGIPTCPITFEYYYDLGGYSEGNYQLDIYDMLNTTPFPIDTSVLQHTESIIFIVSGTPTPVPTVNIQSILLLVVLIGVGSIFNFKRRIK